jgi:hypothetical protein
MNYTYRLAIDGDNLEICPLLKGRAGKQEIFINSLLQDIKGITIAI